MANRLPADEVVTLEEVVLSNSFEIAALVSVLERKGILTGAEVIAEIGKLRGQQSNS